MKKTLSILLMLTMSVVFCATSVFSQNDNNLERIDDISVIDDQPSGGAVAQFNAYLASLDSEAAKLIKEDPELVYMMQREAYWKTPVLTGTPRTTLPLMDYPNGSYYTVNGSACTDHNNCTYEIPIGKSTSRCYNVVNQASSNCIRYTGTGSIQCKGFADYVFKRCKGADVSNSYAISIPSNITTITNDTTGANNLKNFFSKNVTVGSNLRVRFRGASYNHSIIISSMTSTGVGVYECNVNGDCKVSISFQTWKQFASRYGKIIQGWKA